MSETNGVHQPLVFTEEEVGLREEPVTLGRRQCVIVEASSEVGAQFRSLSMRGSTVQPGTGKIIVGGDTGEANLFLVQKCLFEVDDKMVRRPLAAAFVKALPDHVTVKIADRIKDISDLAVDKPASEDAAKNSPTGSTAG